MQARRSPAGAPSGGVRPLDAGDRPSTVPQASSPAGPAIGPICLTQCPGRAAGRPSRRAAGWPPVRDHPYFTPITEEHSRVRTSGGSHSSIIWARPSTLAREVVAAAADVTPGAVPEITLPAACTLARAPAPQYSAAIADNWVGSVISRGGDDHGAMLLSEAWPPSPDRGAPLSARCQLRHARRDTARSASRGTRAGDGDIVEHASQRRQFKDGRGIGEGSLEQRCARYRAA